MNIPSRNPSVAYPPAPLLDEARWIMAVPVVSVSHITLDDYHKLMRGQPSPANLLLFAPHRDAGILLHIEGEDPAQGEATPVCFSHMSEGFIGVVRHFVKLGYQYLRLDGEGDLITGLPTFDW